MEASLVVETSPERRRAVLSLPSDKEILVVREFKAPKAWVFDVWARQDWVRRWWGCRTHEMTRCELDFRVGGRWRFGTRSPGDPTEHVLSGEYREIARADRLVFTERYEPVPGSDHVVTITFDERQGITTMTMHIAHQSAAMRDGHLHSGMEAGLQESLERIDELLAAVAPAS
ncbi:MAG TPA: SRPBCC domain-containing protein [Kofleriaceae bacterium]|nr:SRPBCC domain-containing protein [Kofleriaceae bacterium]